MRKTALCVIMLAAISCSAVAANERSAKNVVIDAEVTRVRLPVTSDVLQSKAELVLRNIRFDVHPGTQFHVILERLDDPTQRARVGTLSFYAPTKSTNRTFDVTDELHRIATADLKSINVVFEATSGRGGSNETTFDPDSKLTIGEVALRAKGK